MLRITHHDAPGGALLQLEGRLTDRWTEALLQAWKAEGASHEVCLDLSALRYVDDACAGLLVRLSRAGTRLIGASALVRELLRDAARADGTPEGARDARAACTEPSPGRRIEDPRAQEELVRRHVADLLSAARRLLGDDGRAGRAVQEAFTTAFDFGLSPDGDPGAELRWHVLHACVAVLRADEPPAPIEPLLPAFAHDGSWRRHRPALSSAERGRPSVAECQRVRAFIQRLPLEHRLALLLTEGEGLGAAEAAGILGIEPDVLRLRVHRARMALCEMTSFEAVDAVAG